MELLSPAGSFEGVVAAVAGGADAVYFGAGDYNARRNAKNLTNDELAEAFRYCRLRGVKAYVTVNTLVTDRELLAAKELILHLNTMGADALIVQDLGMARMIRNLAPQLPMHASTQLSVHNLAGALAAKRLGFSRVVLARELPLTEIAFITQRAGIETEVFCHGALCMCYSGQCYLSAAIGGRSGNRGLCAQPCRMEYSFFGGLSFPYLSLKDLSAANHLEALAQAGVACVKIEGRMKRPEYTALVTSIYKKTLTTGTPPDRSELDKLETLFSRSGFTDGYLTGQKGENMFGVRSEADRRHSRSLYKAAQAIYQNEPEIPTVSVDFTFTAASGKSMLLSAADQDGNQFEAQALPAETALTRATTAQEVESSLRKTGGTVFVPGRVRVIMDDGLRIPPSAINAMRRSCLEAIAAMRRRPPKRSVGEWQPGVRRLPYQGRPSFIFSFLKMEQLTPALLDYRPDFTYLPLAEVLKHEDKIIQLGEQGHAIAPVLDRVIWDSEWPALLAQLRRVQKMGIGSLVCTNLGQLELLRPLGFSLRGDYGLNIVNSQSIKELRTLGADSCTISFEISQPQLRDISISLDSELIVYGRLPLMITENCLFKKRGNVCSCASSSALIDKTGRQFPLVREEGHRTTLLNAEKLYLADKLNDFISVGLRWLRLMFTTENPKECEAIAAAYHKKTTAMPERMTRGLYYRGVL